MMRHILIQAYRTTTIYIEFIPNINDVRLALLEKIIPWMNKLFVMANWNTAHSCYSSSDEVFALVLSA